LFGSENLNGQFLPAELNVLCFLRFFQHTVAMILTAARDDDGRRLDRVLRKALPDTPLSALHRLLRKGRVLLNGVPAAAGDRVFTGACITIHGIEAAAMPDACSQRSGVSGSLDILCECGGLLFLNKPPGLAVHGPGNDSLTARVLVHNSVRPASLSFRPGPLHRLDKQTSGVIVFSQTLDGARRFSALLRERKIRKIYLALLEGTLGDPAVWDDPLTPGGGRRVSRIENTEEARQALSRITPLGQTRGKNPALTLARVEIETGRTHQIRAQAAFHGHPLWRDRNYGGTGGPGGFFLHALSVELEGTDTELADFPRAVSAPLPKAFADIAGKLFGFPLSSLL
jgi:23S rRNA pseudouridine955/2504/2580 synthase